MLTAAPGDLIQVLDQEGRFFYFRLRPGGRLETHRGILQHDALIGLPFGSKVLSHLGRQFYMFTPSIHDLVNEAKRQSQILYPKDIGLILMKLNVHPGQTILEAGTGSGGLTLALANAVGPTGQVISYDVRSDMQNVARRNLELAGFLDRVTLKNRDIQTGFDETDIESFFLDVPNPYDYMAQVHAVLRGGGHFGCLVPTINQVSDLLVAMQRENFVLPEVLEILLRNYKTVPARMRPVDRMVAHTGFLVFARPIVPSADEPGVEVVVEVVAESDSTEIEPED
jgi:tRNA (adenine57-N1/adenine58-N1)-methyltransferase catalytic subunit